MLKVLLVEDSDPVRMVLEKQLRNEGIDVLSAATGEKGLEVAQSAGELHVAILDRVLPGKIDGSKLIKSLRDDRPNLGVVQISGYPAVDHDPEDEGSCDLHLTKPLGRSELVDAVSQAYMQRSIRRQKAVQ